MVKNVARIIQRPIFIKITHIINRIHVIRFIRFLQRTTTRHKGGHVQGRALATDPVPVLVCYVRALKNLNGLICD